MEMSDLLEEVQGMKVMYRYVTEMLGVQFVMTTGTVMMVMLCATS